MASPETIDPGGALDLAEGGHDLRGPGELFVLSAPSGAGKTTLIRRLFQTHPRLRETIRFAVSHTTRTPRPGEVEGVDYHFVDRDAFEELVAADGFLEWAVVHGQLYGTSYRAIESLRGQGIDVLLDIDVQGAEQVRHKHPEVPTLFVLPPSYESLETRLRGRGSERSEEIARRLAAAPGEVRRAPGYEYVIVNDRVERACQELAAVFLARRCRGARRAERVANILSSFPAESEVAATADGPSGSETRGPRGASHPTNHERS